MLGPLMRWLLSWSICSFCCFFIFPMFPCFSAVAVQTQSALTGVQGNECRRSEAAMIRFTVVCGGMCHVRRQILLKSGYQMGGNLSCQCVKLDVWRLHLRRFKQPFERAALGLRFGHSLGSDLFGPHGGRPR